MKYLNALLILVPIALILDFGGVGGHSAVFVTSALAMIPLAAVLGRATEEVAVYTGPKIGGLLNATLGNAAELIITIVALRQGLTAVVKASIAGSIIGNILVVLGFSILVGGLKNGTQRFDARTAGANATMMALAVVALCVPAVFALTGGELRPSQQDIEQLSDAMAIVLIVMYALYILFTLRDSGGPAASEGEASESTMRLPVALGLLAVTTLAIVVMSEVLVGAIEPTAESWGLTEIFIGVMLVPLVGNVAEHFVAVQVAAANKMDLSLGIAIGSGLQIALFVTPVLVLAGWAMGTPLTLVFNSYELAALIGATLIAVLVSVDGESHWLEGAQLIALYVILGLAFFFYPVGCLEGLSVDLLEQLKSVGALKEGHFLLASGRHSNRYIEKFDLLHQPGPTSSVCEGFADRFRFANVDVLVGPTTGGILLAFEVGRQLGVPAAYAERIADGGSARGFRRGFVFKPGQRVLVVDDILTTGGSVRETLAALEREPVEVVGIGVLVDRSGGKTTFGEVPLHALATLTVETWTADECPLCQQGIPVVKPGTTKI